MTGDPPFKLPIEAAYERYQRAEISYEEYRRLYADPVEVERAATRRAIANANMRATQ